MRYVSLAVDAAPTYATFLPVVARMWERLGYRTIAHLERSPVWTETAFGRLVTAEIERAGVVSVAIDPAESLGALGATLPPTIRSAAANTMRVVRLVAAAHTAPGDFVMTADVDMLPLSRDFFAEHAAESAPVCIRRPFYHAWGEASLHLPRSLARGEWRFAMCYAGARTEAWLDMLGLVPGDSAASMAVLLGTFSPGDSPWDLDERIFSSAVLGRPGSMGALEFVEAGRYRQGDVELLEPSGARFEDNVSPGLCRYGVGYRADSLPIDYIPWRFYCHDGLDCAQFGPVGDAFPELRPWLGEYVEAVRPLLSDHSLWTGRCCA